MSLQLGVELVSAQFSPLSTTYVSTNGATSSASITIKNPTVNPLAYKITIGAGPTTGMTVSNMVVTASGITASVAPGAQSTITISLTWPADVNISQISNKSLLGAVRIQESTTLTDLVGNATFPYLIDTSNTILIQMDDNISVLSMLWDSAVTEPAVTFDNGTTHILHVTVKNNAVNSLSLKINKVRFANGVFFPSPYYYLFDTSSLPAFTLAPQEQVTKDISIAIPISLAAQGSPIPCTVSADVSSYALNLTYAVRTYGGTTPAIVTVQAVSGVGLVGVTWS